MVRVDFETLIKVLRTIPEKSQSYYLRKVFSYPENQDTFGLYCFPEAITTPFENFHNQTFEILIKDSNDALAAPRGHGKTTTVGVIHISWRIVNRLNKYIVYISQNHKKSMQFIDPLRYTFTQNPRIKSIYGDLSPQEADKDEYAKDTEACVDINHIRLEALSFEKNIRGIRFKFSRPDLIVGDDIEDDERVMNIELRRKDRDKLDRAIIQSLSVDGHFKMIGTVLHKDSLLMYKINSYGGKIFKAIQSDNTLLCPQLYTRDKLESIRKEIGNLSFNQEYQNEPSDNESSLIKRQHIESCYDSHYEGIWMDAKFTKNTDGSWNCNLIQKNNREYDRNDYMEVWLDGDFAFSDRVQSNYTVFSIFGIRENKSHLIGWIRAQGMSSGMQFACIKELNTYFNIGMNGLEENSIKGVTKDIKHLNLPIKLFWMGNKDQAPKAKEGVQFSDKRWAISKVSAIERLDTSFENGTFVLPYKTNMDKDNMELLVQECGSWMLQDGTLKESGNHPDIPITFMLQNEMMQMQGGGVEVAELVRSRDGDSDSKLPREIVQSRGIY